MKRYLVIIATLILLGNYGQSLAEHNTFDVPPDGLVAFLGLVTSNDFHGAALAGEILLTPGRRIPNHAILFSAYTASRYGNGQIRYSLLPFHGEASAGDLQLTLEDDTGEIISFTPIEASFEKSAEQAGPGYPPQGVGSPDP